MLSNEEMCFLTSKKIQLNVSRSSTNYFYIYYSLIQRCSLQIGLNEVHVLSCKSNVKIETFVKLQGSLMRIFKKIKRLQKRFIFWFLRKN